MLREHLRRLPDEHMVVLVDGALAQLAQERDPLRSSQVVGRVTRSDPPELVVEALVQPPRDHGRVEIGLPLGRRPQEAAAARREGPLVEVGRIPVHPECGHVEPKRARAVSAVGQHRDASVAARGCDLAERQDEGRVRGDVVDDHQPGARTKSGRDPLENRARPRLRIGQLDRTHSRAGPAGGVARSPQHAPVGMVGEQELVALAEVERAQDGVDARGRVVDEHDVSAFRSDEVGDGVGCRAQPSRSRALGADHADDLPVEHARRLPLDLVPQALLQVEHPSRRRAQRPVVEIRDLRVEEPQVEKRVTEASSHRPHSLELVRLYVYR